MSRNVLEGRGEEGSAKFLLFFEILGLYIWLYKLGWGYVNGKFISKGQESRLKGK